MRSVDELEIPVNLNEILEKEGFWEDETIEPLLITIEKIEYKGIETISFQAEFETFEEYEKIDGYD